MKIPECINKIQRLHRLFLELIKIELLRMEIKDISNVQSMLLYNIGMQKVTIGDLEKYGYYLGSNVTYNLRKMVQNGYVIQETNPCDLRCSYVSLSEKGSTLYEELSELFKIHEKELKKEGVDSSSLLIGIEILAHIEKFLHNFLKI